MNTTSTQFLYTLGNLSEYAPSLMSVFIAIIIGIIFLVAFRLFSEYFAGVFMIRRDHRVIEDKKSTLNDLILMKDIQTELEREIEQATLKATFQG